MHLTLRAMAAPWVPFFVSFASKLRRPYLFGLTAALFVINLFVPDFIPFIDEILLGLATLFLGSLKKKDPPKIDDGKP
jgi:hypothetical protein